jgi:hypothetical protein
MLQMWRAFDGTRDANRTDEAFDVEKKVAPMRFHLREEWRFRASLTAGLSCLALTGRLISVRSD